MNQEEALAILEKSKKFRLEKKEKLEREQIILLKREQVNTNNPAIARLNIIFPKSLEPIYENEIKDLMNEKLEKFNLYCVPFFKKENDKHYIIEINSGSKMMYTWFEYLINGFKKEYGNKYNLRIEGFWDKYGD